MSATIESSAWLSDDDVYRYELTRRWGTGPLLPFVMLNPSTADGSVDDPTIRRCMGFARRGFLNGIKVVNLYAYRSTDPKALTALDVRYAIGGDNDEAIQTMFHRAKLDMVPVIAAWGADPAARRAWEVQADLFYGHKLFCLGVTKNGSPRHPLYVKADQPLVPFQ